MADDLAHGLPASFWRNLAVHALQTLRPFIKMNDQQSAAWDLVIGLLGDG